MLMIMLCTTISSQNQLENIDYNAMAFKGKGEMGAMSEMASNVAVNKLLMKTHPRTSVSVGDTTHQDESEQGRTLSGVVARVGGTRSGDHGRESHTR
jgi:hypothetical protein